MQILNLYFWNFGIIIIEIFIGKLIVELLTEVNINLYL